MQTKNPPKIDAKIAPQERKGKDTSKPGNRTSHRHFGGVTGLILLYLLPALVLSKESNSTAYPICWMQDGRKDSAEAHGAFAAEIEGSEVSYFENDKPMPRLCSEKHTRELITPECVYKAHVHEHHLNMTEFQPDCCSSGKKRSLQNQSQKEGSKNKLPTQWSGNVTDPQVGSSTLARAAGASKLRVTKMLGRSMNAQKRQNEFSKGKVKPDLAEHHDPKSDREQEASRVRTSSASNQDNEAGQKSTTERLGDAETEHHNTYNRALSTREPSPNGKVAEPLPRRERNVADSGIPAGISHGPAIVFPAGMQHGQRDIRDISENRDNNMQLHDRRHRPEMQLHPKPDSRQQDGTALRRSTTTGRAEAGEEFFERIPTPKRRAWLAKKGELFMTSNSKHERDHNGTSNGTTRPQLNSNLPSRRLTEGEAEAKGKMRPPNGTQTMRVALHKSADQLRRHAAAKTQTDNGCSVEKRPGSEVEHTGSYSDSARPIASRTAGAASDASALAGGSTPPAVHNTKPIPYTQEQAKLWHAKRLTANVGPLRPTQTKPTLNDKGNSIPNQTEASKWIPPTTDMNSTLSLSESPPKQVTPSPEWPDGSSPIDAAKAKEWHRVWTTLSHGGQRALIAAINQEKRCPNGLPFKYQLMWSNWLPTFEDLTSIDKLTLMTTFEQSGNKYVDATTLEKAVIQDHQRATGYFREPKPKLLAGSKHRDGRQTADAELELARNKLSSAVVSDCLLREAQSLQHTEAADVSQFRLGESTILPTNEATGSHSSWSPQERNRGTPSSVEKQLRNMPSPEVNTGEVDGSDESPLVSKQCALPECTAKAAVGPAGNTFICCSWEHHRRLAQTRTTQVRAMEPADAERYAAKIRCGWPYCEKQTACLSDGTVLACCSLMHWTRLRYAYHKVKAASARGELRGEMDVQVDARMLYKDLENVVCQLQGCDEFRRQRLDGTLFACCSYEHAQEWLRLQSRDESVHSYADAMAPNRGQVNAVLPKESDIRAADNPAARISPKRGRSNAHTLPFDTVIPVDAMRKPSSDEVPSAKDVSCSDNVTATESQMDQLRNMFGPMTPQKLEQLHSMLSTPTNPPIRRLNDGPSGDANVSKSTITGVYNDAGDPSIGEYLPRHETASKVERPERSGRQTRHMVDSRDVRGNLNLPTEERRPDESHYHDATPGVGFGLNPQFVTDKEGNRTPMPSGWAIDSDGRYHRIDPGQTGAAPSALVPYGERPNRSSSHGGGRPAHRVGPRPSRQHMGRPDDDRFGHGGGQNLKHQLPRRSGYHRGYEESDDLDRQPRPFSSRASSWRDPRCTTNTNYHDDRDCSRHERQRRDNYSRHRLQWEDVEGANRDWDDYEPARYPRDYPRRPAQPAYGPITVHQINDPNAIPPACKVRLESTGVGALAHFRIALKEMYRKVRIHCETYGTHYKPRLTDYVADHVWLTISRDLLHPRDRTTSGPPNDAAVEAFLRGIGDYSGEAPTTVAYKEPEFEFRKLVWPETSTFLGGYERYSASWIMLSRTIPRGDQPKRRTLVKIIMKAIKPPELYRVVKSRMSSGRDPDWLTDPSDQMKQRRKEAHDDPDLLWMLIRENASRMDRDGQKPVHPRKQPKKQPVTRQQVEPLWVKQLRLKAIKDAEQALAGAGEPDPSPTAAPTRDPNQPAPPTSTLSPGASAPGSGPTTTPDSHSNTVPEKTCEVDGCNNKTNIGKYGTRYKYCSDHFQEYKRGRSTEPPENRGVCALAGCDKPREWKNGRLLKHCSPEHWEMNGGLEIRKARQEAAMTAIQAQICRQCGGDHNVLACPVVASNKTAMEQAFNYRHSHEWWVVPANAKKAVQFRRGSATGAEHQWAQFNPDNNDNFAHGWAVVCGRTRLIYFDLGGHHNIMDDTDYDDICSGINEGKITDAEIVTPESMGYDARGVPIDLACASNTSMTSIVRIDKWVCATIRTRTKVGQRQHRLTQQYIGFMPRSSHLLILGQTACKLCGYRTIEQQDADRAIKAEVDATTEAIPPRTPQYAVMPARATKFPTINASAQLRSNKTSDPSILIPQWGYGIGRDGLAVSLLSREGKLSDNSGASTAGQMENVMAQDNLSNAVPAYTSKAHLIAEACGHTHEAPCCKTTTDGNHNAHCHSDSETPVSSRTAGAAPDAPALAGGSIPPAVNEIEVTLTGDDDTFVSPTSTDSSDIDVPFYMPDEQQSHNEDADDAHSSDSQNDGPDDNENEADQGWYRRQTNWTNAESDKAKRRWHRFSAKAGKSDHRKHNKNAHGRQRPHAPDTNHNPDRSSEANGQKSQNTGGQQSGQSQTNGEPGYQQPGPTLEPKTPTLEKRGGAKGIGDDECDGDEDDDDDDGGSYKTTLLSNTDLPSTNSCSANNNADNAVHSRVRKAFCKDTIKATPEAPNPSERVDRNDDTETPPGYTNVRYCHYQCNASAERDLATSNRSRADTPGVESATPETTNEADERKSTGLTHAEGLDVAPVHQSYGCNTNQNPAPNSVNKRPNSTSTPAVHKSGSDDAETTTKIDGYVYVGARAFTHMEACAFVVTDKLRHAYITTAALRRSGCHPANAKNQALPTASHDEWMFSKSGETKSLRNWLIGGNEPHSRVCAYKTVVVDEVKLLHVYKPTVLLRKTRFTVIPGNDMRVVLGTATVARINNALEADASPLQHKTAEQCSEEIQMALKGMIRRLRSMPEITKNTIDKVREMLYSTYTSVWKAKYDLSEPATLPPMVIQLMPGAKPAKIRRRYRWTQEQHDFVAALLEKLVNVGIISRVESQWCCPIVLVIKPDLTWRLCVDPSVLNKFTVPMMWDVPRTREEVQRLLRGVTWMCQFDFVSMFWQIPLHEDSRKLFCFYAGDLGIFQFNRVAMGALNSSIYTQRMVTMMFRHVRRKDGRHLLHNGLIVQTDDVLLYAAGDENNSAQEEMLEILDLFLHTVACHNLSIHPGKCKIYIFDAIYCGLRVTREGIGVDPDRLAGLVNISPPRNVGDVWQFNAAVGWIREDIPLFSEASSVLTGFITAALKNSRRRNMRAAKKVTLQQAGWGDSHQRAWDTIKKCMMETITTSYRDRRLRACLFTDACKTGWTYAITQCEDAELDKPWALQKHEILAVNSGNFRDSQVHWHMGCKEAYPIRLGVERHRHILQGNHPFASINDHASLQYIFDKPSRKCVLSVAARDRLERWAAYLRSYTFDTVHIPGDDNHFCDLLSRNGCSTAAAEWDYKRQQDAYKGSLPVAAPQFAVIKPLNIGDTHLMSNKDMDLKSSEIMPSILGMKWPSLTAIHTAQQRHNLETEHKDQTGSTTIYVDAGRRIVLPQDDALTNQVIAVCHQGDIHHRSAKATVTEFRRHFRIHGLNKSAEAAMIYSKCRKCLACIKTKTGQTIPRPLWYMVYATRPFEYIHADFMDMPDAADGSKHVLIVTCDFSLTTLIHPCKRANSATVVEVLLNHWLSVYPDPVLLHTDGGSHFNNEVVKGLASRRGWEYTICTPYAKWTHAVAERMNKTALEVFRPLCRQLKVHINKWTQVVKVVQGAINRMRRKTRGNMSPIQLTTGIEPRTAAMMMRREGNTIELLDEQATLSVQQAAEQFTTRMEELYDLANVARRAKSEVNRNNTDQSAVPRIGVGDYVLYANLKPDTKLDYIWRGPGKVTSFKTPLVYEVAPATKVPRKPLEVHIKRLRRFAGKDLNLTEQLKLDIEYDHPGNTVQRILKHRLDNGILWMRCRWKGLTKEQDSWQTAAKLAADVPYLVTKYFGYRRTVYDDALRTFQRVHFPSYGEDEDNDDSDPGDDNDDGVDRAANATTHSANTNAAAQPTTAAQSTTTPNPAANNTSSTPSATTTVAATTTAATTANTPSAQPQRQAPPIPPLPTRAPTAHHMRLRGQPSPTQTPVALPASEHADSTPADIDKDAQSDDGFATPASISPGSTPPASPRAKSKITTTTHDPDESHHSDESADASVETLDTDPEGGHIVDAVLTCTLSPASKERARNNGILVTHSEPAHDASKTTVDYTNSKQTPSALDTIAATYLTTDTGPVQVPITKGSSPPVKQTQPETSSNESMLLITDKCPKVTGDAAATLTTAPSNEAKWDGTPSTKEQKRQKGYTLHTEVRQSTIPGAGLGLFMLEKARPKDRVAKYSGVLLTTAEKDASTSEYIMTINSKLHIDAQDPSHWDGRYINDGLVSNRAVNARFGSKRTANTCEQTGRTWISVFATKVIKPGQEVLVDYGDGYNWSDEIKAKLRARAARSKRNSRKRNRDKDEPPKKSKRSASSAAKPAMMARDVAGGGDGKPPNKPNKQPDRQHLADTVDHDAIQAVLREFQALQWTSDESLAYAARFRRYMREWHAILGRTLRSHLPPVTELIQVMTTAVRPITLRESVRTAMRTGRGPQRDTHDWRLQASSDLRLTVQLIREYARAEQETRDRDLARRGTPRPARRRRIAQPQRAHEASDQPKVKPPVCSMILESTHPRELARFRRALRHYEYQAQMYRTRYDPQYRTDLTRWVTQPVWDRISIDLLRSADRTYAGDPTNDPAVMDFIRGERRYDISTVNRSRAPTTSTTLAPSSHDSLDLMVEAHAMHNDQSRVDPWEWHRNSPSIHRPESYTLAQLDEMLMNGMISSQERKSRIEHWEHRAAITGQTHTRQRADDLARVHANRQRAAAQQLARQRHDRSANTARPRSPPQTQRMDVVHGYEQSYMGDARPRPRTGTRRGIKFIVHLRRHGDHERDARVPERTAEVTWPQRAPFRRLLPQLARLWVRRTGDEYNIPDLSTQYQMIRGGHLDPESSYWDLITEGWNETEGLYALFPPLPPDDSAPVPPPSASDPHDDRRDYTDTSQSESEPLTPPPSPPPTPPNSPPPQPGTASQSKQDAQKQDELREELTKLLQQCPPGDKCSPQVQHLIDLYRECFDCAPLAPTSPRAHVVPSARAPHYRVCFPMPTSPHEPNDGPDTDSDSDTHSRSDVESTESDETSESLPPLLTAQEIEEMNQNVTWGQNNPLNGDEHHTSDTEHTSDTSVDASSEDLALSGHSTSSTDDDNPLHRVTHTVHEAAGQYYTHAQSALPTISARHQSILQATDVYVVHQTNCIGHFPGGLARHMFNRFPWADTYTNRLTNNIPGTITVHGNDNGERLVVNMHAQLNPGMPSARGNDTASLRLQYFQNALQQLATRMRTLPVRDNSVAFPFRIGCGLAGGNWQVYLHTIIQWARRDVPTVKVTIYCLNPGDASNTNAQINGTYAIERATIEGNEYAFTRVPMGTATAPRQQTSAPVERVHAEWIRRNRNIANDQLSRNAHLDTGENHDHGKVDEEDQHQTVNNEAAPNSSAETEGTRLNSDNDAHTPAPSITEPPPQRQNSDTDRSTSTEQLTLPSNSDTGATALPQPLIPNLMDAPSVNLLDELNNGMGNASPTPTCFVQVIRYLNIPEQTITVRVGLNTPLQGLFQIASNFYFPQEPIEFEMRMLMGSGNNPKLSATTTPSELWDAQAGEYYTVILTVPVEDDDSPMNSSDERYVYGDGTDESDDEVIHRAVNVGEECELVMSLNPTSSTTLQLRVRMHAPLESAFRAAEEHFFSRQPQQAMLYLMRPNGTELALSETDTPSSAWGARADFHYRIRVTEFSDTPSHTEESDINQRPPEAPPRDNTPTTQTSKQQASKSRATPGSQYTDTPGVKNTKPSHKAKNDKSQCNLTEDTRPSKDKISPKVHATATTNPDGPINSSAIDTPAAKKITNAATDKTTKGTIDNAAPDTTMPTHIRPTQDVPAKRCATAPAKSTTDDSIGEIPRTTPCPIPASSSYANAVRNGNNKRKHDKLCLMATIKPFDNGTHTDMLNDQDIHHYGTESQRIATNSATTSQPHKPHLGPPATHPLSRHSGRGRGGGRGHGRGHARGRRGGRGYGGGRGWGRGSGRVGPIPRSPTGRGHGYTAPATLHGRGRGGRGRGRGRHGRGAPSRPRATLTRRTRHGRAWRKRGDCNRKN